MARIPVAVLGSTGIVGQRLIRMLASHPIFRLAEVTASNRRTGQRYGMAASWCIGGDPPRDARALVLLGSRDRLQSRVVMSALPSTVAAEVEVRLAEAGHVVCTNASAHRMRRDVPLIVPEVNADAAEGVVRQRWSERGGALVANPNCVVTGLAVALAPIERAFGIHSATVVTLQALSGAGRRGLAAMEMAGNIVPWIRGEEEKIGDELNKVLGTRIHSAVTVTRVPVPDGHTAHVFLKLRNPAPAAEVEGVLRSFKRPPDLDGLPTLPARPLRVRDEPDRPQPRLDADAGRGMAVSVGRIRTFPPYDAGMVVLSHNAIRGAAGACLANAELCVARGLVAHCQ